MPHPTITPVPADKPLSISQSPETLEEPFKKRTQMGISNMHNDIVAERVQHVMPMYVSASPEGSTSQSSEKIIIAI